MGRRESRRCATSPIDHEIWRPGAGRILTTFRAVCARKDAQVCTQPWITFLVNLVCYGMSGRSLVRLASNPTGPSSRTNIAPPSQTPCHTVRTLAPFRSLLCTDRRRPAFPNVNSQLCRDHTCGVGAPCCPPCVVLACRRAVPSFPCSRRSATFCHLSAICHSRMPTWGCLQVSTCTPRMVPYEWYCVLGREGTGKRNLYFCVTHLLH